MSISIVSIVSVRRALSWNIGCLLCGNTEAIFAAHPKSGSIQGIMLQGDGIPTIPNKLELRRYTFSCIVVVLSPGYI